MFGTSKTEGAENKIDEVLARLVKIEESNIEAVTAISSFSVNYKEVVSGGLRRIADAFQQQNQRAMELTEVLEMHLEVARLRAGLETTDRGAYDSLLRGLKRMSGNCRNSFGIHKQYQGVSRKIESLIKELEILEQQAHLDALIQNLLEKTSKVRKDKVKPSNTE